MSPWTVRAAVAGCGDEAGRSAARRLRRGGGASAQRLFDDDHGELQCLIAFVGVTIQHGTIRISSSIALLDVNLRIPANSDTVARPETVLTVGSGVAGWRR